MPLILIANSRTRDDSANQRSLVAISRSKFAL